MSGSEKGLKYSHAVENEIVFESYGVRFKIQADDPELLREAERTARKALLERLTVLESKVAEHTFAFKCDEAGTLSLFVNGKDFGSDDSGSRKRFFKFFNSMLRIVVAEHAIDYVFIHAGVVGWKGKAIVLPANSFQGKTTLVAELVKNGADYFSDEYAVLDADGLVHPFPRDLSVRDEMFQEEEVSALSLGGKIGSSAIPVGAVVLTGYDENAEWKPERLTVGQGIMEIIPHTIPRIFNTAFSLKVLNTAVSDAIILKSPRGDARQFASELLSFF